MLHMQHAMCRSNFLLYLFKLLTVSDVLMHPIPRMRFEVYYPNKVFQLRLGIMSSASKITSQ